MSLPTVDSAKRIAAMMHRKLTTHWSDREVRQYKKLVKSHCFDDPSDLALMERYYIFERKRGENGRHRRDLITLLNNWQGELDRATAWAELHPVKPKPRVIIPYTPPQEEKPPEPLSPEDEERVEQFRALMRERNPQSKAWQPRSAFQKAKQEMGR